MDWYEKYHLKRETPEFNKWWIKFYNEPTDYDEREEEQNEYWIRKSFALEGWLACKENNDLPS